MEISDSWPAGFRFDFISSFILRVTVSVFTALQLCRRDVPTNICLSVCPSVKCVDCLKTKAPSEKSSITTNRKSPTTLLMSLRWTSYVAPNPPKGPQRRKFVSFPYRKLDFPRRKSATKFLCVKTFSGKVVRHSLAYLSVHKWLVGDVPLYLKFSIYVTHPLLKRRFPVYIRL